MAGHPSHQRASFFYRLASHQRSESNALSLSKGILRFARLAGMAEPGNFFVYILRCSDGSFYVGHSTDVKERVASHNSGRGASWTANRRPVVLVDTEPHETELEAITRERQLKGWTRAKKEALLTADAAGLKELSRTGEQETRR
jgi:putative endonuclease